MSSDHVDHILHLLVVFAFLCICALWLDHLIKREDNTLTWEDLVSIHGADGKSHADWTKIGQGVGVFIATFIPLQYAIEENFDPVQGALLMGASLAYLGGVAGYSATLRSKREKENGPV